MANRRRQMRARLECTISALAIGIFALCPQVAAARPDREAANPVSPVSSEDLKDLPANRDAGSMLKDLPSAPNAGSGSNPSFPSANLRGITPTSSIPAIDREQLESLPLSRDMKSVLDLHNMARAEVGSAPLRWNPSLAAGAQGSAEEQARTGVMKHAGYGERTSGNFGENLSLAPRSGISPEALAKLWFDEKRFFQPGAFPNICTGDWSQCGHYSQMIWSQTTDVGCGFARDRFVALVCRYSPPGNMFGQPVLGIPPNNIGQGPVIAINTPPQPAAPPQPPPPACQVPEADDFITLLNEAAIRSGFAMGAPEPGDGVTDRYWQNALDREQQVQDRLMKELATLQGNVAKHINDYLAAASAWQGTYAYISSTTTGLQGLLTNWLEAREVYEKADLAFALANLGVGGVKLGFKAYKFFTRPRVAGAGAGQRAAEAVGAPGAD
ncbi:MAG: CAP domain-containing protein [Novosphingobium sp.]|nr:CAP domain-containing protein [Novosphingobium sp.]